MSTDPQPIFSVKITLWPEDRWQCDFLTPDPVSKWDAHGAVLIYIQALAEKYDLDGQAVWDSLVEIVEKNAAIITREEPS